MNYPIKILLEKNIYYVSIPDFNMEQGITYGDTLEEAIKSAKEVIILELMDLEENNKEFPKATELSKLNASLQTNEFIMLLDFNYSYEKSLAKISYKKKTLSIPVWLDILATNKNINFSQVLQKALKKELL